MRHIERSSQMEWSIENFKRVSDVLKECLIQLGSRRKKCQRSKDSSHYRVL